MPHASTQYDIDLFNIQEKMREMTTLVSTQFDKALQAFLKHDTPMAREVETLDKTVNHLELLIDDACLHIIVKRQPAATDLRFIIATLKIVTDLERVGDESAKIARIVYLPESDLRSFNQYAKRLEEAHQLARAQLQDAIEAFSNTNQDLARDVINRDKKLDQAYTELLKDPIAQMSADPKTIQPMLHLMSVARAIERIGDHAKNIAEYVVFLVAGKDIRHPFA